VALAASLLPVAGTNCHQPTTQPLAQPIRHSGQRLSADWVLGVRLRRTQLAVLAPSYVLPDLKPQCDVSHYIISQVRGSFSCSSYYKIIDARTLQMPPCHCHSHKLYCMDQPPAAPVHGPSAICPLFLALTHCPSQSLLASVPFNSDIELRSPEGPPPHLPT
jgi:hypothetical protein